MKTRLAIITICAALLALLGVMVAMAGPPGASPMYQPTATPIALPFYTNNNSAPPGDWDTMYIETPDVNYLGTPYPQACDITQDGGGYKLYSTDDSGAACVIGEGISAAAATNCQQVTFRVKVHGFHGPGPGTPTPAPWNGDNYMPILRMTRGNAGEPPPTWEDWPLDGDVGGLSVQQDGQLCFEYASNGCGTYLGQTSSVQAIEADTWYTMTYAIGFDAVSDFQKLWVNASPTPWLEAENYWGPESPADTLWFVKDWFFSPGGVSVGDAVWVDNVTWESIACPATPVPTATATPTATPIPEPTDPPGILNCTIPTPVPVVTVVLSAAGMNALPVDDTFLCEDRAEMNFGAASNLVFDPDCTTLIKWTGLNRYQGRVVTDAKIRLFVLGQPVIGAGSQFYTIYPVLPQTVGNRTISWTELQSTWTYRIPGTDWNTPGARGNGTDISGNLPSGYFSQIAPGWIETSLWRPLVQNWINVPQENHGVAIINDGSAFSAQIASSEWFAAGYRPQLVLTLQ